MMRGKNILVTGASRGMGRGIAEYLLKQGANVILVARNKPMLDEIVSCYPNSAYAISYDLSNVEEIEKIFLYCKEKGLKLDGLVHAAGISDTCAIKMLDAKGVQEHLNVNFVSYAMLCKYFMLKKYSTDGSSIVAVSSMATHSIGIGLAQYTASKGALELFTKVMAKEAIKRKIRVNAIAPGYVDTDMGRNVQRLRADYEEYLEEVQPMGVMSAEHVAYLVEFLLSEKSTYITETVIPISGGMAGA